MVGLVGRADVVKDKDKAGTKLGVVVFRNYGFLWAALSGYMVRRYSRSLGAQHACYE